MTFKDLEDWQKKLMVKDLKDGENIYIEYTKDDIIAGLKTENQGLKKRLEEHIKAEMKMEDEFQKLEEQDYTVIPNSDIKPTLDKYKNQQKEFIEYLENEKNRLAKECSHTYEDSLGKLLYVNEDIFNEVNKIISKYKEITGGDNK